MNQGKACQSSGSHPRTHTAPALRCFQVIFPLSLDPAPASSEPRPCLIRNHVWKGLPAWLFRAFPCLVESGQNAGRALYPEAALWPLAMLEVTQVHFLSDHIHTRGQAVFYTGTCWLSQRSLREVLVPTLQLRKLKPSTVTWPWPDS